MTIPSSGRGSHRSWRPSLDSRWSQRRRTARRRSRAPASAATRAILEEFPDARIIALTTYAGDEDIHQALDAGAMGYLVKDMMVADVLKVIRLVMAGRR